VHLTVLKRQKEQNAYDREETFFPCNDTIPIYDRKALFLGSIAKAITDEKNLIK
jgi:hypothetical protein